MSQPIAIISRSCIFPESPSPQALWKNLLKGRDLLSKPEPTRWRARPSAAMEQDDWDNPGGYVRGFDDIFDADQFDLDADVVTSLDPLFQWVLHTANEAYRPINRAEDGDLAVLLGNLSLPSEGLSKWTEAVWQGDEEPATLNRYMSGLPAHLVGPALGRRADAFSLDAACASSLYAIGLGCEKLREQRADIVLAGAVNRADPLFLNIGFQALQALSPSGRSRPFHRGADGLIPTEGAAFVGLKRLDDAIDSGDDILGVIHGVGLSNDGRSDGLLAPASAGQIRAIEKAYERSDIAPDDVSYIECHATGTPVGDGREIESLAAVFSDDRPVSVGSHKSNMGHSITAAGMAGLLKVLGGMEHSTLPPTIHVGDGSAIDALDDAPFELVTEPQPWDRERKVAAIDAFGFGGNNSHLIVENWRGDHAAYPGADLTTTDEGGEETTEVAVVGFGLVSGFASSLGEFGRWLATSGDGSDGEFRLDGIDVPLASLKFPPSDLEESLPQQVAMLKAAMDAADDVDKLDAANTGVFTGMQTDPEIARHGLRARLHDNPEAQDAVADPLTAPAVVGSLPNIVANRINSHFDLTGYSFATSAEEHAGDVALREAVEAIERGQLDAAIVGAVEMTTDTAQSRADAAIGGGDGELCDAAVAFMVKCRDRAEADGDDILAIIDDAAALPEDTDSDDAIHIETPRAHSATGLLRIGAAIAAPEFALPRRGPASGIGETTTIANDALQAPPRTTTIRRTRRPLLTDTPTIHRIGHGRYRATIAADGDAEFADKKAAFRAHIDDGSPLPDGVYRHTEPLGGDVAQAFTGAAGAYHNMGLALCLAFPELVADFKTRFQQLNSATTWMFHPDHGAAPTPLDKLFGSSVLSQIHSDLATDVLGIDFDCAIGFSSGETNALFAAGVWRDFDGLFSDFSESQAFERYLGGEFELLNEVWSDELPDDESAQWRSVRVTGPEADVQAAIAAEPLAHLLIKNAPGDVTIGGHAPVICRVLDRLPEHGAIDLDYDIAVHCPELAAFETTWHELHSRPTHPTDLRIYGHGVGADYEPTRDNVADALLDQATDTIDFPQLIRKAWDDGVRTFVEHGPRSTLASWIDQILADRPHNVVSLDVGSTDSLRSLARAAAELDAAGVDVDIDAFNDHIERHRMDSCDDASERTVRIAAHRPDLEIPNRRIEPQTDERRVLPRAPELPSVNEPAIPRKLMPDRAPRAPKSPESPKSPPMPASTLPAHFQHLQNAYHQYLDVIDRQSDIHREFIEQMRRGWQLAGATASANQPVDNSEPAVQARRPELRDPSPSTPAPQPESGAPQPLFDRQDLITHASGDIADIFGPMFERQKNYPRQVRMPEPPLLLADRVMDIDAEKGVIGTGTVWTETDITADSWYLFRGHIPPGVMIEAGQADLLLISWMGADFENEGRRAYRLLGCELTYQKGLPEAGDTLEYDIHIDGHAKQGDVRIFFFHYDCRVGDDIRLSVREGQAGFFTDEELAESMGILWTPESGEVRDDVTVDPPRVDAELIPTHLSADDVQAFADGDVSACFGEGYQRLRCHSRTPNIEDGDMCLIGGVEELTPGGGPWGRGYMKTVYDITGDDWFFDGHFKGDPCMPGTLMFETTLEAMAFYMIAMGFSLDRDGWRFEPVPDIGFDLKCRGQATPDNDQVVYEIFVEEVIDGDRPRLVADVLATVDGLKAFHGRGIELQLVPDTPMGEELIVDPPQRADQRALRQGDLVHDKAAMLATARGPATMCMGPDYRRFDGPTRMPRLPGEPFQFMTRVVDADSQPGCAEPGDRAVVEWEIPNNGWFFEADGNPWAPSAVLMEAALQPCGWLSLYSGAVLDADEPLYYRNLDGTATLHRPIGPDFGTFTTETRLTRDSTSGAMTIQSFDVECFDERGELVYDVETTFGFFPRQALREQSGLPTDDVEQTWFDAPSETSVDLSTPPAPDAPQLWPDDRLRMIDTICGRRLDDGSQRYRATKRIDPAEWFFKAHFYQDPVMPGSLGIEAMFQTLRYDVLQRRLYDRFDAPIIEPVATGREVTWTYRGQVLPEARQMTVLLEMRDTEFLEGETTVVADASLWVDGTKIYAANGLVMRVYQDPASI